MVVCVYEGVELNVKTEEHVSEWIRDNIQGRAYLWIALCLNCRLLNIKKF
jgi:hypothetical protein